MHVHVNSKVWSWYIDKLDSNYIEHDAIKWNIIGITNIVISMISIFWLLLILYIMARMGIINGLLQKSFDKACD